MIVLNANTLAVSTYSVDPLDVVSHGGETYFLTATGLTRLDPALAPGTISGIRTGKIKPEAFVGASFSIPQGQLLASGQDVALQLTADQYGEETAERYALELVRADVPRNHLELTDAAVEGTSWTVAVESSGTFSLRALKLLVNAIQTWRR